MHIHPLTSIQKSNLYSKNKNNKTNVVINNYQSNTLLNFKSQPIDNKLNNIEKEQLFAQITELSKEPSLYMNGSLGKVYKVSLPLRPLLAVKEFKEVYEGRNPRLEAHNLQKLPKDSYRTQKFVDLIENNGKQYLVTTFQKGESLSKLKDSMSSELIHNILDELFKIEKEGISFYDYSMANIVFNGNEPKFFDFEIAKEQSLTQKNNDAYNDLCHLSRNIEFPLITNLAGFEIRTVGKIIGELEKYNDGELRSKNFVKKYLKEAAIFYQNTTDLLIKKSLETNSEINKDAIVYSHILSKLFKEPTQEIINIEKQSMRIKELLTEYWYRNDPDLDHDDKLYSNLPEYVNNLRERFNDVQKSISDLKQSTNDLCIHKYCDNTSKLLQMISNKELTYLTKKMNQTQN